MPYGDSQTGTPVTLVVPPQTGTGHPPPPSGPSHVPFTGFDLPAFLLVALLLLVLGTALAGAARRFPPRLAPARPSTTHSRRTT